MPIEIIVPRLGWSMEEGAFVAWLKQDGEFVESGDRLFSIEGDKAIQEIESIDSGILRIAPDAPKPGDPIRVGDILGHLLSADEAAPSLSPTGSPGRAATGGENREAVSGKGRAEDDAADLPLLGDRAGVRADVSPTNFIRPAHSPTISPRALRAATELGVDWTTIKGSGRTGRIRERDIRAAVPSSRTKTDPATSPLRGRGRTEGELAANPSPWGRGQGEGGFTVLVTGGCGFIGTWVLRELLQNGIRAVVLDVSPRPARWERIIGPASAGISLVQGNLFDWELLSRLFAEHQITHVIHLAALLTPACQADPWEGCRVNLLGTVALFERIRLSAGRVKGFSYASSVAVFGDEPDHASGSPEAGDPVTFYGAYKKSMELVAEQYWRHFKIPSLGIRPQVVYGPERDVGLTAGPSLAARAAALGEKFTISYTGRVGYDYVEDVAHAFVRGALETPPGADLIDLPGEVVDVNDILSAILKTVPAAKSKISATGPLIPAHAPPHPRFISKLYPDWKTTPFLEGIRRTIEFYCA